MREQKWLPVSRPREIFLDNNATTQPLAEVMAAVIAGMSDSFGIARHAGVEWYSETCVAVDSNDFIPARWARRRPSPTDDMKSVVYLCCPVQTTAGWSFITALTTFIKGDWDGVTGKRLLPARKLDFNDPVTAAIFREVHNLGNWVVNYDELLDRRQLLNQSVKVIPSGRLNRHVGQQFQILPMPTAIVKKRAIRIQQAVTQHAFHRQRKTLPLYGRLVTCNCCLVMLC